MQHSLASMPGLLCATNAAVAQDAGGRGGRDARPEMVGVGGWVQWGEYVCFFGGGLFLRTQHVATNDMFATCACIEMTQLVYVYACPQLTPQCCLTAPALGPTLSIFTPWQQLQQRNSCSLCSRCQAPVPTEVFESLLPCRFVFFPTFI